MRRSSARCRTIARSTGIRIGTTGFGRLIHYRDVFDKRSPDEAISQAHPSRVIRFFQEFMNQAARSPQARSWGGASSPSGKIYSRAEVQRLYENHRRGAYRGREEAWARQEADIIAASREGRIRGK
jgi:hypothetical protein